MKTIRNIIFCVFQIQDFILTSRIQIAYEEIKEIRSIARCGSATIQTICRKTFC